MGYQVIYLLFHNWLKIFWGREFYRILTIIVGILVRKLVTKQYINASSLVNYVQWFMCNCITVKIDDQDTSWSFSLFKGDLKIYKETSGHNRTYPKIW